MFPRIAVVYPYDEEAVLTALIENPRLCSPKFLTCEQRSV